MKKLIGFISLGLLVSSCAFHSGIMTSNPNFTSPDYELTSFATGTASTEKFFGIGGLSKDALVFEAKKNLYSNFPLKKGQSYSNLTVDFKNAFYLIYCKTTVTISADIVQPDTEKTGNEKYQPLFNKLKGNQNSKEGQILSLGNINVGDTVMTYSSNKVRDYIVTNILSNDHYVIRSVKSATNTKNVDRSELFITKDVNNNSFPFKINQEVSLNNSGDLQKGKIIAIGENESIVEAKQGNKTTYLKITNRIIKRIQSEF